MAKIAVDKETRNASTVEVLEIIRVEPETKRKFLAAAKKAGYSTTRAFVEAEYENKRHSMNWLGEQAGTSAHVAKKIIRMLGIHINLFQKYHKKPEDLDMPRVMALRDDKKTIREIAIDQGASASTIGRAIQKYINAHPTISDMQKPKEVISQTIPCPIFAYPSAQEILAAQYPAAWAFAHGKRRRSAKMRGEI